MQIGLNLAQSRPALVSKYSHDGCVRPARRGPGPPGIMLEITALIVRMARERARLGLQPTSKGTGAFAAQGARVARICCVIASVR
jgi:hypothetical protein